MNKINKVLIGFFIIVNGIITYFIANNRWVNMMPNPMNSIIDDLYDLFDLFLGRGFPTILIALTSIILLFVINKLIIKQEIKLKNYIILFCIIFIINIIIYRIGINTVV